MKYIRTFLKVLLAVMLTLTIAAIVAYFTVLPGLVRSQIASVLRRVGATHAAFDVQHTALDGLQLRNILLGMPQWGSIDRATVTYNLSSLWNSRVHRIELSNVTWIVRVRDGEIELGPEFATSQDAPRQIDMPFDQLLVRDVTLIVEEGDRVEQFNADVVINRTSQGKIEVELDIEAADELAINRGAMTVNGFAGRLLLRGEFKPGRFDVYVNDESTLAFDSVVTNTGSRAVRVSQSRLALPASPPLQPLARINTSGESPGASVHGTLHSLNAMTIQADDVHAFVPTASAAFAFSAPKDQVAVYSAEIAISQASLNIEHQQVAIEGITATIPIDFNAAAPRRGPFAAESITWRDTSLPGFTGDLGVADQHLEAKVHWQALPGAMLTADASLHFAGDSPQGKVTAHVPAFELANSIELRNLAPALREIRFGGTYQVDATVQLADGRVDPLIQITAADAHLENPDWPLSIQSANGTFVINSISPFTTPADQRLYVQHAKVGELEIHSGTVAFALNGLDEFHIQHADWSMGELGHFRTAPFQFKPSQPRIQTALTGENIGLGPWLQRLTGNRAGGEGTLAGTLALVIKPGQRQVISLGGGSLRAQPPTGTVFVTNAAMLSRVLEQSAPSEQKNSQQWRQVQSRLVDALMNYRYSMLQIEFIASDGSLICRLQTQGRGRSGPDPQEIAMLTINIHNFNDVLREVIFFGSAFSRME